MSKKEKGNDINEIEENVNITGSFPKNPKKSLIILEKLLLLISNHGVSLVGLIVICGFIGYLTIYYGLPASKKAGSVILDSINDNRKEIRNINKQLERIAFEYELSKDIEKEVLKELGIINRNQEIILEKVKFLAKYETVEFLKDHFHENDERYRMLMASIKDMTNRLDVFSSYIQGFLIQQNTKDMMMMND